MIRGLTTFGLPPLEMALIKATYGDDRAPKSKHLEALVSCTHSNPEFDMVDALSQRFEVKEWLVSFKTLIVWHHLCNRGHPSFFKSFSRQAQKTDMSHLNLATERKVASRLEFIRGYGEYLSERALSFHRLKYSVERVKLESCKEWAKNLDSNDLTTSISSLTKQLKCLLKPEVPDAVTGAIPIFSAALTLLARDSIVLFSLLSLLFLTLLDKLQLLSLSQTRLMVTASAQFIEQTRQLATWSRRISECVGTQISWPNFTTDCLPSTFVQLLTTHVEHLEKCVDLPDVQTLSLESLTK